MLKWTYGVERVAAICDGVIAIALGDARDLRPLPRRHGGQRAEERHAFRPRRCGPAARTPPVRPVRDAGAALFSIFIAYWHAPLVGIVSWLLEPVLSPLSERIRAPVDRASRVRMET